MIYSGFGVLLFSGFILVDTSRMLHRYTDDDYVAATLGLYLDIVNLFLFVLRLVGGGNNRR
jgi:FtsH-binding integral membrane protein